MTGTAAESSCQSFSSMGKTRPDFVRMMVPSMSKAATLALVGGEVSLLTISFPPASSRHSAPASAFSSRPGPQSSQGAVTEQAASSSC